MSLRPEQCIGMEQGPAHVWYYMVSVITVSKHLTNLKNIYIFKNPHPDTHHSRNQCDDCHFIYERMGHRLTDLLKVM